MTVFRVPSDPIRPSFDEVEHVGFWHWLFSSSSARKEWQRRRNVAAQTAQQGQEARLDAWHDRRVAETQAKHAARAERKTQRRRT